MAQEESASVTKVKYPVKGYRTILDIGLSKDLFSDFSGGYHWGNYVAQVTTIHGYQFMPQLYVGVGAMLEYVEVTVWNKIHTHYYSFQNTSITTLATVRYDIIPWTITPYIEGRIGYRKFIDEFDLENPGRWYSSPCIGVRFRRFNLGFSYETIHMDVKMKEKSEWNSDGVYYYHDKKYMSYPVFHMSLDFGARKKRS
jgi:hypothetical protein